MDQEIQQLREEVAALLALVKQQQAEIIIIKLKMAMDSQEGAK